MRRTLILAPRAVRTLETSLRVMETPVKMSEKKNRSPAQLAARKERETDHKQLMENLDVELKEVLIEYTAPEPVVQNRKQLKDKVERALQDSFGPKVGVESIGLDRLGLSMGQAPFELAVVDRDSDPQCLPSRENTLYHTRALIHALEISGIHTKAYSPPNWISSESASRPFALPEPALVNEAEGLVLVPPDPSHSIRLSLVEDCMRKFPSMRSVLGLLYIFATRDTDAILPPLTSRILSHLTLAYYRSKYAHSATSDNPSSPILSFYSHPSSVVSPDSSIDTSLGKDAPIIMTASRPSDFPQSRKSQSTTAYDLLDLLRWWDQLRWDHHVIMSTSPTPLHRSFDARLNEGKTWDFSRSPLILQDPIYPLNNLATLLTSTGYSELRTSFRSIHRSLCAGSGLLLARKQPQLLRTTFDGRSFSTAQRKSYGEQLTESMKELYARSRPTHGLENVRLQAIERLRHILHRWYGPQYVPVLFGSSRYGVSDKQSDLDIVILDGDRPHGFTLTTPDLSLPAIYKLNNLANSMKKQYGKVTVIPAKVPIIKARDPKSNLAMDININDRLGLFNTELLEHYCRLWPPLSNLIYVIKKWAKARGLNEPAGAKRGGPTFSSYCLTLMTVGFLQSHRVLPNLHEIPSRPSNERGSSYFWIKATPTTRMKCWVHWHRLPADEWEPVNNPSLGRAFYAWLHYFTYDHKYDEFAIRIAEGGIVPRHGRRKKPKTTTGAPTAAINPVSDQDVTPDPSDMPATTEDKGVTAEIEVVPDDLDHDELASVVQQDLEEDLTDGTFVRDSHLEEPDRWLTQHLVVGDPFIITKNCAANISKNSIMSFKDKCKNSLEAIDAGKPLRWLLTGETYYPPPVDAITVEEIQKRTNAPDPSRKKGKGNPSGGGNVPQTGQNQPQNVVIAPKQRNTLIYETTGAGPTD